MAARYWWPSGGTGSSTGNWSSTTNWSSSSVSYVSAAAPTAADDANFGSYSGASAFTVTVDTGAICGNLIINNTNMTLAGSAAWTIGGSATVTAFANRTYTGSITFNGAATVSAILNFGSMTLASGLTFNRATTTWSLGSALSTTGNITLTSGTFTANAYNVTCNIFNVNNSNTRTLNMGSGIWTITAATLPSWNATTTTGLTFNSGRSTISFTNSSGAGFAGGGITYYNINQGGAGTLTITGSNTFNNITNSVQPTTVKFGSGTTNTFANFNLNGTAGNLVTINSSTAGTRANLVKTGADVSCDYLNIKDIAAA